MNQGERGTKAMIEREMKNDKDARYRDRRAYERYDINASGGSLKYHGVSIPCHIVDISLGGCSLRTENRYSAGNLANVEVVVPIHGMFLHMVGITQWISGENLIGIRFLHPSARSKNQLAGLLTCLVDQSVVEVVAEAVVAAAEDPLALKGLAVEVPQAMIQNIKRSHTPVQGNEQPESKSSPSLQPLPAPKPPSEKVARNRESDVQSSAHDDWTAILHFLKDGSHLMGAIASLNQGGCTVQTAGQFQGAILSRVEVEFQMRGIALRLAGVIEEVPDKHSIEIRFLDISSRRQAELAQLLEELRAEDKKQLELSEGQSRSSTE